MIVTVPVAFAADPITLSGLMLNEVGRAALTLKSLNDDVSPKVAVIRATTSVATAIVETENDCELDPAAKLNVAGVVAAPLLLARVIDAPPAGAPVLRVTVANVLAPPVRVDWASVTDVTVKVSTVSD